MMNLIVQFSLAFSIVLLQAVVAAGQVGLWNNGAARFSLPDGESPSSTITKANFTGLREDRQTHYKPAIPFMSLPLNTSSFSGDSYWLGSVTTQSYNRGKIGRYYYWDMLGNLQGSHLFLDVAGKRKRGLKLVFPRQRTFY
jgi:hypothetical protein